MKIRPVGQKDGRTDMTKSTVALLNFAKSPNKQATLDFTKDAYLTDYTRRARKC
jgi:hypothetical protein